MNELHFAIFIKKENCRSKKLDLYENLKNQSYKNISISENLNNLNVCVEKNNSFEDSADQTIKCIFNEIGLLNSFFFETALQIILKESNQTNTFQETQNEKCYFFYKNQIYGLSKLQICAPFPLCEYLQYNTLKKRRTEWYNQINQSAERFDRKLSIRDFFRGLKRKNFLKQNQIYYKFSLLSFATDQFKLKQRKFDKLIKNKVFKKHTKANNDTLHQNHFFKVYKDFSPSQRGYGFWLWKPFLIAEHLKKMPENHILCYIDSGDMIRQDPIPLLNELHKNFDILLNLAGAWRAVEWTKRDTFIKMKKDKVFYQEQYQIDAGFISVKKTVKSVKFIDEWFQWCQDFQIISDNPCVLGENYKSFRDHRHDQAILNLLSFESYVYRSRELNSYILQNV